MNKSVKRSTRVGKTEVEVNKTFLTNPPAVTKCVNCQVVTGYTRKFIRSILIIMTHLKQQSQSKVVHTFPKLPDLLNSVTQRDMVAHWMTAVHHDLEFLESYAGKIAKTKTKVTSEKLRLKQLDQTCKSKLKNVQRILKRFQEALHKIVPSFYVRLKIQTEVKNLIGKILNGKVNKLKRNVQYHEELMRNKYEPKMKSIEEKLKTVTSTFERTESILFLLENQLETVYRNNSEIKLKYDLQLFRIKEVRTQFQDAIKENETLKDQIRNKTIREEIKKENVEKGLKDLKEKNQELKETIKQCEVKLKAAMQMNYKVTKQLAQEKQSKDNLKKSKEENEEIGRMKMLALEEMNSQLKEKLQFSTNLKKDLAARFNCDLSDTDDAKNDLIETKTLPRKENETFNIPNLGLSHITGNPYADIKFQIVANFNLIKQLEEEILYLNKLRVKIKANQKMVIKKPDG